MIGEVLEKKKSYTIEEYFELEKKALYKNEFRNGKIIPMIGGCYADSKIIANLLGLLYHLINDEKYDILGSEQGIFIPKYNHIVYSDNCVIDGSLQFLSKKKQVILNPCLVFEVASKFTQRYDRIGKFKRYKSLPSFQEYVLIEQDVPVVEVFTKENNKWNTQIYVGLDEVVILDSVGCKLKMIDIYKKINDLLDLQIVLNL